MKLKFLELNNIGLYKAERLDFQTSNEKDTILIWGNNGAGKTTFINSLKVGLLGPKAFSLSYADYCEFVKNNLISTRANEEMINASIIISLESKKQYTVVENTIERRWTVSSDSFEETVDVFSDGKLMTYEEKNEYLDNISQALTPSLLDVIVFDGENVITVLTENRMDRLIKEIINSVFGMGVYSSLSKDLSSYLRSAHSDDTISSEEQVRLINLESDYKVLLKKTNRVKELIASEETKRIALSRRTQYLINKFSEKTGISVEGISEMNESLLDIQLKKEKIDADIKYINEEILPLKLVHGRIKRIIAKINAEQPLVIWKSIDELKSYFSNSSVALESISELEKMLPEKTDNLHFNLSEEEINTLKRADILLDEYTQESLRNNISKKNSFVEQLKDKIDISGKVVDNESQIILSELDEVYKNLDAVKMGLLKLSAELNDSTEEFMSIKNEYESFKQVITKRKKNSNSYSTVMAYRTAIDEFIDTNVGIICEKLNELLLKDLNDIKFRNNSIGSVQINPQKYDLKIFEKKGNLIPSSLLSAGEKQVLLGLIMKEALSLSHIDTFVLFDTPVGRLDSVNRSIFTNEVIFSVSDQVFIFATDSDYSVQDYQQIKKNITKEFVLHRNENDEIILAPGSIY